MNNTSYIILQDALRQCERHLHFLHYASDSIKFDDRPMLDKLHRLEKLGYLDSMEQWHTLRSVRNSFAHDYPQDDDLKVAYLNQAIDAVPIFENILAKVRPLLLD